MLTADAYTTRNLVNLRMQATYRMSKLFEDNTCSHADYPEMKLVGVIEIMNLLFKDSGKAIMCLADSDNNIRGFSVICRTPSQKSK